MIMPQHKNPNPVGYEIKNFGRPFLGHYCYILRQGVEKTILFLEIMHFYYMIYIVIPLLKNKCPGGHEIYNFIRHFLRHYYCELSFSESCPRVENKIFKKVLHFHCMTYMVNSQHKNPCPGGHEIDNFVRPFLGHHYNTLSSSESCL